MAITARCPNCGAPAFDPAIGRCAICLWQTAEGVHLEPATRRDLIYSEISDGALIFCAILSVIAVFAWLIAPVVLVLRGANPLYLLLGLIGALQGFGVFVLFIRVLDLNRADYRLHAAPPASPNTDKPQPHRWWWLRPHWGA
jgi:hypothetical protein